LAQLPLDAAVETIYEKKNNRCSLEKENQTEEHLEAVLYI